MSIDVHKARARFSRLLERAHRGEVVIISKRGKPWARLGPLDPPEPRRPGFLEGEVGDAFFEPLPEDEIDAWES